MATYKDVEIDTTPTDEMVTEAQRGLDWRKEYGRGGTEVGVARARDIINKVNLSADTVRRMHSYFSRHEVDKKGEGFSPGEDGYPSAGRIAWALWGGDPGQSWAKRKVDQMDKIDDRSYEERPYPNEHAARLTDPDRYDDFRREEDAGGEGIDFIYGIKDGESELQAIRFDKDEYSEAEAKQWLAQHEFDALLFEPATNERQMEEIETRRSEPLIHRANDMEPIIEDDRRVRMAISSELPVERMSGSEVLEHTREAIDMEFLNSGRAPLLLDHDATQQIGVVESVELDESARKLRAIVRFGKGERASEVYEDVKDGIRGNVSIGYYVKKVSREDGNVYRAKSWQPLEVSVVSIPADPSVGVGRSAEAPPPVEVKPNPFVEVVMSEPIDTGAVSEQAVAKRNKEVAEMLNLAAKHNQRAMADEAIAKGVSIESFRGMLLDKIGDKPLHGPEVDLSPKEKKRYSLLSAIRSAAENGGVVAGFEREVSAEIAKHYGKEARGFFVPTEIFKRDVLSTSPTNGSNLIPETFLAGEFIDALRPNLVIAGLGARMMQGLKGEIAIPALNAKTQVGFFGENSAASPEGAPTFRQVTMTPREMRQFVDISRKMMRQTDPSVEQVLRQDLLQQFAAKIDDVAIEGGGSNEPTGILKTSGIGSVALGTNGGQITYASLVNLEREVAIDNALAGSLAYLTNPKVVAKMRTTPRQASGIEGNFILNDTNTILGYRVASTTLVPSDLTKGSASGVCSAAIFGNFNELMIGMFGGLDVLVDPYTGSAAGTVRVAMYQDIDVAVRHAESFAAIQDILTT
jgi:HK97 family phage major capsid protein/HK97 family phage prohead protease